MKGKVWATYIPAEVPKGDGTKPRGVAVVARDFQLAVLYNADGSFAGVRRIGSGKPIEVEGLTITIEAVIGSTGLELKSDPGVPIVYAGFGGAFDSFFPLSLLPFETPFPIPEMCYGVPTLDANFAEFNSVVWKPGESEQSDLGRERQQVTRCQVRHLCCHPQQDFKSRILPSTSNPSPTSPSTH